MAQVHCESLLSEGIQEGTLLHLLGNHLVLSQTLPYLPPSSILNLAATSHAFRAIVRSAPPFRRLDLTNVKAAHYENEYAYVRGDVQMWRAGSSGENHTEDE